MFDTVLKSIGIKLDSLQKEVTGTPSGSNNPSNPSPSSSSNSSPGSIDTNTKEGKGVPYNPNFNTTYGTKKPLGNGVKTMEKLTFDETKALAKKIFGEGPATELLIKIDGGSGMAIKRMIALGYHEGGLKFGRQNPDPRSGYNIGTFQMGGLGSTRQSSLKKYAKNFEEGVKLAKQYGITKIPPLNLMQSDAQKDLLAHLGYIQSERFGESTFAKLRNPNLSTESTIYLMHRTIQ